MAFKNLIITVKKKIGGIKIDGVITESTRRSAIVSSNPIENGSNISDHVIKEPMRYSMTGIITNTPIGSDAATQLFGSVVDVVTGIFGKSEQGGISRSRQAYQNLVELLEAGELISVDTGLRSYDNLIFESISVDANKETSNGISFSASFVQAIIVQSARQDVDRDTIDGSENSSAFAAQGNSGVLPSVDASDLEEKSIRSSVSR